MQVEVTTRKWGNSIGIALPKEMVQREGIRSNQKITIEVRTRTPLKAADIFGGLKLHKSVQQIMSETDRDFEG